MVRERVHNGVSGVPMVGVVLAMAATAVWLFVSFVRSREDMAHPWMVILALFMIGGFLMIAPNEAQVLQLFGSYAGTAKEPGLRWANPLFKLRKISLRVRNFESSHLKVNDQEGNPIEMAAVVVWRVVETAEASFEVDDYQNYVRVQ